MSDPFSYLKMYKELTPYFEAVEKIKTGEYISDLEDIKKACIKANHKNISWGDKGLECIPEVQMLFKITLAENESNKNGGSETSITRKRTLEKRF